MPFKKGKKKTGGKKKGTPNKKTTEIVERIESVLSLLEETLVEDIQALSERDRVQLWETLQEYIRPKLSRSTQEIKVDESIQEININVKKSKS